MRETLSIATRSSPLALWQAKVVQNKLSSLLPNKNIILQPIKSEGDEITGSLTEQGGKNLFAKRLQLAVLNKDADIAVHSVKDLSVTTPNGLSLAAILKRDKAHDAWITNLNHSINNIKTGAIIGTSSPRRTSQLLMQRPDLKIKLLRGNVQTRLQKLDDNEYDAIILAAAGLIRLGLENKIHETLDIKNFIPAIGQGAIGVECRADDIEMQKILHSVNDTDTQTCISAEREVNVILGGDCHSPIAAHATLDSGTLNIKAMVGAIDGSETFTAEHFIQIAKNDINSAKQAGRAVAEKLQQQGAEKYL